MVENGLIEKKDLEPMPHFHDEQADYHNATVYKKKLFYWAYERFKEKSGNKYEYEKFCTDNSHWLEDFALFVTVKNHFHGQVWNKWPCEIRDRKPESLQTFKKQHHERIELEKYLQFLFFRQWFSL